MGTVHPPRRQIKAYQVALRVSKNRHILVEGSDDRNILARLIQSLRAAGTLSGGLDIDTAEDLESLPGEIMGNLEKVEAVCAGVTHEAFGFAGFVDRQFRGFDRTGASVSDRIRGHYV